MNKNKDGQDLWNEDEFQESSTQEINAVLDTDDSPEALDNINTHNELERELEKSQEDLDIILDKNSELSRKISWMKLLYVLLFVAACAIGVLVWWGIQSNNTIDAQKDQINQLQGTSQQVSTQSEKLKADLDKQKDANNSLRSQMDQSNSTRDQALKEKESVEAKLQKMTQERDNLLTRAEKAESSADASSKELAQLQKEQEEEESTSDTTSSSSSRSTSTSTSNKSDDDE